MSKMSSIRRFVSAAAAVCALAAFVSPAGAQGLRRLPRHHRPMASRVSVKLGALAGASFPQGMSKLGVDPGWTAGALLDISSRRSPIGVRLDGTFTHLGPSAATAVGAVTLWGGDANLVLAVPGRLPVRPYLTTGVGLYRVRNTVTASTTILPGPETKPAWNAGAGLRAGLGPLAVFLEARYLQVFTTGHDLRTLPVTFGVMVGGF